ncbi:MAG: DUF192 domain-containing protein [Peptococcaceae bacterium]|jgi:uncharacterized membrane protein (UPF0127 family)|nr:DUF192 domain-containing protein [Peptococcaceae bacterium]MDH7524792.1 DUF192 domain-containing protein [Peptococcaceae bacterium]
MKGGEVLGWNIRVADTFFRRLTGLWGKRKLFPGEGLLLVPCRQVHTWFMSFPVDLVFLDRKGKIVELAAGLPPWKISPRARGGFQVLELPQGTIEEFGLQRNDVLEVLRV